MFWRLFLTYLLLVLIAVGLANMILRHLTTRPAVLIAPGTTAPVAVPMLSPPDPPVVTD